MRRSRLYLLLALGGVGAAALVAVLIVLYPEHRAGDEPVALDDEVIEIVPEPLARGDLDRSTFNVEAEDTMPILREGGSIQATEDGRLAQAYRFDRLDPHPPGMPAGWARLDRPRAEIYLAEGRVLSLEGDTALAHVPKRVIESGTITGNVTIRLFESSTLDPARDRPMLEVHTHEARFDNVIGEVRCDGDFHIATPSLEFPGRALTMLVNDREKQKPLLNVRVEEVEFVRLARQEPDGAAGAAPGPAPSRTAAGDALSIIFSTRSQGLVAAPQEAPADAPVSPDAAGEAAADTRFYRLTLSDDVRIRQGPRPASRDLVAEARRRLGAAAGDSIAPELRDDDVYVTCTGPLTVTPIDEPSGIERLDSPRDARLILTGAPVRLTDVDAEASATCARLIYTSLGEKVELVGSLNHPLALETPQVAAGGNAVWLQGDRRGFTGPGWVAARAAAGETPARTTWTERLDLEFERTAAGPGALRRASFAGGVVATGDRGELAAREIDIDLAATGDGRTVPTRMVARGGVRAADPQQTVWADTLSATFDAEGEMDRMLAEGGVQVALADGARAFADRLAGDAAAETAELTGADVALAYDNWLLDGGRTVQLDGAAGTAHWEGAGRARLFAEGPAADPQARIDRAWAGAAPQLVADWKEWMHFDRGNDRDRGSIELAGDVVVVAEPGPLKRDRVAARGITLVLGERGGGSASGEPDRSVERVIARGDAKLESRSWTSADRSDAPRIFYVAGDRLEYDQHTGEALVPGAGELLISDPRPVEGGGEGSTFAARGQTSFRWDRSLEMARRGGTLYDITMLGGIEMRHRDPDGQASTLTCGRVEATVDQAGPATDSPTGPLDGAGAGASELVRLRAEQSVFLRTPQRDIDCDVFEYDVAAGRAVLLANPGGRVTVYTRGDPQPLRLERGEWDVNRDEVTVTRGTR